MQVGHETVTEVGHVEHAHVRAVDRDRLLLVEAGGVGQHLVHVEVLHELLRGEDVLVRGEGPAQQAEVVQQALRDEAVVPVQEQVGLRIALGQLLVALAHHVGQVAEHRHVPGDADRVQGAVERDLARSGREQVLAAQHVGDAHERVVHRVHEGVQRRAVRADHHEVRHGAGLEGDLPAHQVGEGDVLVRHAQPPDRRAALGLEGGDLLVREVTVVTVVAQLGIAAGGPVTGLGLLGARVGRVDVSAGLELLDHVRVDLPTLGLTVRLVRAADLDALVPVDPEPAHRLEQLLVGLLRVALGVRVLDAEHEGAAGVPRPAPVEQDRADQPHVGGAGGRGGEAHAHGGLGVHLGDVGEGGGGVLGHGSGGVSHDAPSLRGARTPPSSACVSGGRRWRGRRCPRPRPRRAGPPGPSRPRPGCRSGSRRRAGG